MTEFETRLNECLEALREGRWDLDECVRRNPEHAAALRPMLVAATMTARAYDVQPRAEFASAARERFLVATGQRLQEAMDIEPSPAFFAAARMRFLMAAQRMKLGEQAPKRATMPRPSLFGSPMRALAGGLAAVVVLLGASTYTVSSASAALPGDWQYPIKLQTERVRVALAFSETAKRDVKLGLAEERVSEIEQLTKHGKIIGPGVLDRLVRQTQPLIDDAKDGGWQADEAARLDNVSKKQQEVLADASAQISPDAQQQVTAVTNVSNAAHDVSKRILFFVDPDRPPAVLTPSVPLTATPPATQTAVATPSTEATQGASTPGGSGATEPAASTPVNAAPTNEIVMSDKPEETRNGIKLFRVTVGSLTFLAPGSGDGWKLVDTPSKGLPPLIKFANADDTSLITISTVTGDMYWYIGQKGHFDEVQMRIKQRNGTFVADRSVLRTAYENASDVPWFVLQSIALLPPPPTPTATSTATATSTVAPESTATATPVAASVLTPVP